MKVGSTCCWEFFSSSGDCLVLLASHDSFNLSGFRMVIEPVRVISNNVAFSHM